MSAIKLDAHHPHPRHGEPCEGCAVGCICRPCHDRRRVECLVTSSRGQDHPDHLTPDCPSTRPATLGDTATCLTCRKPITYCVVEEHGYKPRTGWSDGYRVDALVCFQSIDYSHKPTQWPTTPATR